MSIVCTEEEYWCMSQAPMGMSVDDTVRCSIMHVGKLGVTPKANLKDVSSTCTL